MIGLTQLKKSKKAFTLVEILVVILIISLLFVFLVPKIDSAQLKAREAGIKTDFRSYQTAFESVARENSGLGTEAIADSDTLIKLVNEYLDPALKITGTTVAKLDPWNQPYTVKETYQSSINSNGYIVLGSCGKDGKSTYDWYSMISKSTSYKIDATGRVTGSAQSGCLDADLERARMGLTAMDSPDTVKESDDYLLATWYIDGQIFTATAGFTTNIESGILAD